MNQFTSGSVEICVLIVHTYSLDLKLHDTLNDINKWWLLRDTLTVYWKEKKQFDVYDIFVTATYSLIINQGSIYHTYAKYDNAVGVMYITQQRQK